MPRRYSEGRLLVVFSIAFPYFVVSPLTISSFGFGYVEESAELVEDGNNFHVSN